MSNDIARNVTAFGFGAVALVALAICIGYGLEAVAAWWQRRRG